MLENNLLQSGCYKEYFYSNSSLVSTKHKLCTQISHRLWGTLAVLICTCKISETDTKHNSLYCTLVCRSSFIYCHTQSTTPLQHLVTIPIYPLCNPLVCNTVMLILLHQYIQFLMQS